MFGNVNSNEPWTQSTNVLHRLADALFTGTSFWVLIIALLVGWLLGKLTASILRRVSRSVGRQADASSDLATVNRLRRVETWLILSIALLRVFFFILALYVWWILTHPSGSKPTALVGASAILIVIVGGVFSPLLRDFAFGSGMMAEHWFGVGDLITIIPYPDVHGVVERITLRSTRIRGLNGEVIWVANQNIMGVRIAQKGVWGLAIELFVTDANDGERLIERVNQLLPTGPSLVATQLRVMSIDQRGQNIWHLTAVAETAPGREWLIQNTAVDLLKDLDEKSKSPILLSDPVARYADTDTERQFARAIKNAKKTRRLPRRAKMPPITSAKSRTKRKSQN